ncbi:MAG: AAA family ATPase [Bacteroidetes bacterium SB0662_bin_6]|nr:AAA family ATPase [Bacteroidetes bacterium SB0668_bin_1]MYE05499.1 AAA family ATPase [Bacteroidetes bacterium SB0662_bin_6]
MPDASNERKTLQDQAARDIIAEELDCNAMVFAGAGAGKTYALVQRMVALVRTGACEVDRMAAITFTRKAAGEMRVRFFQALREAADPSIDPEERGRIDAALDRIDQCFMGTIHSFCGRLIRTRPIEAGLAPGFSEVEGREEARLLRDTWDRFVEQQYQKGDSRLEALRDAGLVPNDLYAFFRDRCQYSDVPLKETDTPKPDFESPVKALKEFLDSDAILYGMPRNPRERDKLMDAVLRAQGFLKNNKVTSDADAAEALAIFENAGRGSSYCVTLKHWLDRGKAKSIRDELFPAFWDQAAAPALRAWREYQYGLAAGFVEDAVNYSARRRLEDGKLTFQDLLLRARDLLRENMSVREHLQSRYRVLFVDEFQDTDPIQAEIIFYLTGQETSERDWRKLTPRPGSLFLVGDAKQSIYRFRRADIAIGRFVRARLLNTGGKVLQLNTSFRSLGALCRWMNGAFAPVFAEDSAPRQAAFEPLLEYRPEGADAYCVRKITIPKLRGNNRAAIAQQDARRIVSFIAQALRGRTTLQGLGNGGDILLKTPASPGDFLILTRTKGQLATYMGALEEAGIPYVGEGGDGLGESEEVQTVLTLLEAVLNPGNPVPFLAFLRGPLAGLSDDMLYAYREAGGIFHWNADSPKGLPEDMARRFCEAKGLLRHAGEVFVTLPPAAALQSVLAESGYLALATAHPDGNAPFRAGNLIRLLALVQGWAAEGYPWGWIVEELRSLVEESSKDVAQMSVEFGRSDVVRVMNVHQAKGLEAPVVFLTDSYDTSYEKDPSHHVSRSDEGAWLSMPIRKQWGSFQRRIVAQPAGWEADQTEEARFAQAEEARLLYVAATRARNLLVVSVYDTSVRGPWTPLRSALANVPELESAPSLDEPERTTPDDGPGHAELLERAGERLHRAKEASYALRSVTGEREEATPAPQRPRKQGRGVKYGRLVHQLFEEAVRGDLPDNVPARVHRMAEAINRGAVDADLPWTEDALTPEDEAMAVLALERFKKAPLWETLQRAHEVYTEVPLAVSEDSGAEGISVVRGVIDLVYRDDAGWHIIDYKTDRADTEEQTVAVRKEYQPQLDAYTAYWRRLTGASVADAKIWLAHGPDG